MKLARWALIALSVSVAAPVLSADIVAAFTQATLQFSPRQDAVDTAMQAEPPLEELVANGLIASPYDCIPELRTVCFDVLAGTTDGNTVIYDWGGWLDAMTDAEKADFIFGLIAEAEQRGFALLTDQELGL